MTPHACSPNFFARLCCVGTVLLLGACAIVPSHDVSVDAIAGPTPVAGQAYRLVDHDPLAAREPRQHKLVFACVAAALDAKTFFEAPAGTPVDFTVEVDYGSSRPTGVAPTAGSGPITEHFLEISARRPKPDGAPGKGEEIWNVRASVFKDQIDLTTLIPVLATVAADHAGMDTQIEKKVKVSEKQPNIVHVKSVARAVYAGP